MFEVHTLKDNVSLGQWEMIVPIILQQLGNLFGGMDPGHYAPDGRFIPGDLQNRLNTAAQYIARFGVGTVANKDIVYDILTEVPPPQFASDTWQNSLQRYLKYLQIGIQNGTIRPNQINNPLIPPGTPGAQETGGGFAYNLQSFGSFLPLAIIGGVVWAIVSHKKHKRG